MSEWSVHHSRSTPAAACCCVCHVIDAGSVLAPWFDQPCRCNAAEIDVRSEDPSGGRINPGGGGGGGGVGGGDTCSTARQPNAITSINRHAPALAVTRAAIAWSSSLGRYGSRFKPGRVLGIAPKRDVSTNTPQAGYQAPRFSLGSIRHGQAKTTRVA